MEKNTFFSNILHIFNRKKTNKNHKTSRKRKIENRKLSKDEVIEAEEKMEELNNPFYFESFCGSCDNFNSDDCPFWGDVHGGTNWKWLKCEYYMN